MSGAELNRGRFFKDPDDKAEAPAHHAPSRMIERILDNWFAILSLLVEPSFCLAATGGTKRCVIGLILACMANEIPQNIGLSFARHILALYILTKNDFVRRPTNNRNPWRTWILQALDLLALLIGCFNLYKSIGHYDSSGRFLSILAVVYTLILTILKKLPRNDKYEKILGAVVWLMWLYEVFLHISQLRALSRDCTNSEPAFSNECLSLTEYVAGPLTALAVVVPLILAFPDWTEV